MDDHHRSRPAPPAAAATADEADAIGGSASRPPPLATDDEAKGLHLLTYRKFLPAAACTAWWETLTENVRWHRVKYKSARFGKPCETPCYTAFYGGFAQFAPFEPVPPWLQPLLDDVSRELGAPFNAFLLRLYLDGNDEIAWHTDGRTFLGERPTIGSLSLGATASFQLRRMRSVWPALGGGDDGVDRSTPQRDLLLADGDLLVMHGPTQRHWHHRVPKASGNPLGTFLEPSLGTGTTASQRRPRAGRGSTSTSGTSSPARPTRSAGSRRTTSTWCTATRPSPPAAACTS